MRNELSRGVDALPAPVGIADDDDQRFRLIRAEAWLAGDNRLLEMVASGDSLHSVLDALCQFVEENITGCCCSVVLIDSTARG